MILAGMFVSCENDLGKIQRVTATDDTPSEIVEGLHTMFSDSGKIKFEIIASRMERYTGEDERQLFKNGFEVNFFGNDGSKTATLSADYGELRELKKAFNARNNVIFTNYKEGQTLKTEELFWDQALKKVRTDKYFEITDTDGYWARGYGMESDETFSKFTMHDVTAQYEGERHEPETEPSESK